MVSDINNVDALIICGGLGTRLKSVLNDRPKILAEINGRPFISYLIDYLETQGISRIILCTGHGHEEIEEWVTRNYTGGVVIEFSREISPLGTGGAVKNAEHLIRGDDFLVLNGDTFFELDYNAFVRDYFSKDAVALLATSQSDQTSEYGTICTDQNDRIIFYGEKIKGEEKRGLISGGVYMFNKKILRQLPSNTPVSLEYDSIPNHILPMYDKAVYGHLSQGYFLDIGTPKNYHKSIRDFKKRL